ncbi:hypothetical protein [Pseudomonas protegens]|uniref:hypothetical protein n=1 Tax=Pseudomonas protegens TaxID=380021 RepID=UPI00227E8758|nr:hypothetical protein [Pseudomonas protegens]MCY7263201.1 hypothetical protein [Pseudomonas protegens]
MTKKSVIRLEKSLRRVREWASSISLPTTSFEEYLEGHGNIGLAVSGLSGLFVLGMDKVNQSLLSAEVEQWSLAKKHLAFGFARMLYSEIIGINNVKKILSV